MPVHVGTAVLVTGDTYEKKAKLLEGFDADKEDELDAFGNKIVEEAPKEGDKELKHNPTDFAQDFPALIDRGLQYREELLNKNPELFPE